MHGDFDRGGLRYTPFEVAEAVLGLEAFGTVPWNDLCQRLDLYARKTTGMNSNTIHESVIRAYLIRSGVDTPDELESRTGTAYPEEVAAHNDMTLAALEARRIADRDEMQALVAALQQSESKPRIGKRHHAPRPYQEIDLFLDDAQAGGVPSAEVLPYILDQIRKSSGKDGSAFLKVENDSRGRFFRVWAENGSGGKVWLDLAGIRKWVTSGLSSIRLE